MPTANNAVCAAVVNGDERVYSFGGIGTGLDRTDYPSEGLSYSTAMDVGQRYQTTGHIRKDRIRSKRGG